MPEPVQLVRFILHHGRISVGLARDGHLVGRLHAGSVAELLRRRPGYCAARAGQDLFFCADEVLVGRFVEGLRRAGLPERLARRLERGV
jgi:hypothetical protein